jgi:excisionase family DNA binding protein
MNTGNQNVAVTPTPKSITIGRMLFTVEEAAERLGVHKTWLYERTRKKVIPFRKLGKYVRFSEQDLQAIISGAEVAQ